MKIHQQQCKLTYLELCIEDSKRVARLDAVVDGVISLTKVVAARYPILWVQHIAQFLVEDVRVAEYCQGPAVVMRFEAADLIPGRQHVSLRNGTH